MSSNVWLLDALCSSHAANPDTGAVVVGCTVCAQMAFKTATLSCRASPVDRERINVPRIVSASG